MHRKGDVCRRIPHRDGDDVPVQLVGVRKRAVNSEHQNATHEHSAGPDDPETRFVRRKGLHCFTASMAQGKQSGGLAIERAGIASPFRTLIPGQPKVGRQSAENARNLTRKHCSQAPQQISSTCIRSRMQFRINAAPFARPAFIKPNEMLCIQPVQLDITQLLPQGNLILLL